MRNEQSASYAAAAVGYLTGRPGACLVVSGPGVIHGIAGLSNAWANCWPMILIGGACGSYQEGMGAFQEAPQVESTRLYTKLTARPDSASRIPFYVEHAVRTCISGRPGAAYLDFPDDLITAQVEESEVMFPPRCPDPARPLAEPTEIERAIEVLRTAERPLVIVGKGAAYSHAEDEVRRFIEATQVPFQPGQRPSLSQAYHLFSETPPVMTLGSSSPPRPGGPCCVSRVEPQQRQSVSRQ